MSRAVAYPSVIPYDKQSVAVPGTKRPGQTAHYQNGIWGLIGVHTPNALTTVDEIFECGVRKGKDRLFLGYRPTLSTVPLKYANHFVWQSYGDVDIRRRHIGSALTSMFSEGKLGGGEYGTVGIWSVNRPEWQIIDIALASYNKVSVSLYDTLGEDSVEYIIRHSHLTVVFATSDHIPTLLKLGASVHMLKLIVCIDDVSSESIKILTEWGATQDVQLTQLKEFEAYGKAHLIEPIPATPETVASVCYTSGTTSTPKGVLLKHKNLALATQSNLYGLQLPEVACLLSYLPLAHIYERTMELCVMAVSGKIGYFTGDPLRLLEDAQLLKPNFFPSVPRVLNRVYQAAMLAAGVPGLKATLFKKAIQVKLDKFHSTGDPTHIFWDKLVFRKIQAVLGGQIQLLTCGSAPISPEVMDFLKIAFGCEVVEGYGMTENCATCTKGLRNDGTSSGTVGPPQPVNEVKLIDVPAMGYTSEDSPNPRGELCVRGENCFTSYYKDEKNTKEAVDEEGWVHTGDVAEIDHCGRVKIVDRVKNIMKLAQGEYVALEKIENIYSSIPVIAQIYVHGDSLQSYLLAVIIPDTTQLAAVASRILGKTVAAEDLQELVHACRDDRIKRHILQTLTKEAKRRGLKGFEMVKRIHLSLDAFTVENGTLTPTMKIRRKDAYNKYKSELDRLYALGESSSKL